MSEVIRKADFRVCLMGASFDTNNRGVSALASSCVNLVKNTIPSASFSFFMGYPKRIKKTVSFAGKEVLIDVINYRMSPRANPREHILLMTLLAILIHLSPSVRFRQTILQGSSRLNDLDHCDFIGAINGGDSFSDIYGLRRFIEGMLPIIITILLGKKLVLLPQTYGPYNSGLARAIARWIILRSSAVLSRDHDSITLIKHLLGNVKSHVPIHFCPDVAFTLPFEFPASFKIDPPADMCSEDTWVGININGLLFHGGYTGDNMFGLRFEYKAFMLTLIEKLMEETSSKIVLIPHTYGEKGNTNSDPEASRQIYEALKDKCKDRLYLVLREYKEFEVKGIIGHCDFFIGSRMHACIAAISQGIPTAAVAYSKKFRGVFEGVGLETMVVDARSLDMGEAVQRIIALYLNREADRGAIKQKIDLAKEQVKEAFTHLLNCPDPDAKAR